ncbi:MAG: hypothetical protein WD052_00170 [Bacteroidales bacterium]
MRETMLILHLLGLAMGLGASFALVFLGRAGSKMDAAGKLKFSKDIHTLTILGNIGIGLLIITGGYLMTPFWSILGSTPLLIAKLLLVLGFAAFMGVIGATAKRAKNNKEELNLKKIDLFSKLALLTGLIIVIFAVNVFH